MVSVVTHQILKMTIDELEYLIKDYDWSHFEAEYTGQLSIAIRNSPALQTGLEHKNFYLRVGLHMNRPFKAIICDGQFVRMTATPEYNGYYDLRRLDPSQPNNCLYNMPRRVFPRDVAEVKPLWKPFEPLESTTTYNTSYSTNILQPANRSWKGFGP